MNQVNDGRGVVQKISKQCVGTERCHSRTKAARTPIRNLSSLSSDLQHSVASCVFIQAVQSCDLITSLRKRPFSPVGAIAASETNSIVHL